MVMECPWKYVRETDVSSENESLDSDQIDSDVEAELYSVLHHEDSFLSSNNSNNEISALSSNNESFQISYTSFEETRQTNLMNHSENNISIAEISQTDNNLSADEDNRNLYNNFDNNSNIYDCVINKNYNTLGQINALTDSFNIYSSSKRKSDSESNIFGVESSCKKIKEEKLNESNSKCDEIISVVSSSDEDNDIICIEPSNNRERFETNVSQCVLIDSDSDSSDSWTFKLSNKNITSTPSASKDKELWHVDEDDAYRSRRISNRYHDSHKTCRLCNQKGHTQKFCSFSRGHRCFICGDMHPFTRCKKRICGKCFGNNHDMKYCPMDIMVCNLCRMPGHHDGFCPDLWRRHQRTTTKKNKKPTKVFQDVPLFCYNCGLSGHFGGMCRNHRLNFTAFPTWPFVLNFKISRFQKPNLNKKSNCKKKKGNKKSSLQDSSQNNENPASMNSSSEWKKEKRSENMRKKRMEKRKRLSNNANNLLHNTNVQETDNTNVQETDNTNIQQINVPKSSPVNKRNSKSPKNSEKEPIWLKFKRASIAKKRLLKKQKKIEFLRQQKLEKKLNKTI